MPNELDGRVAVVTGGARGIGRATVERFVAEGAHVVVADIDADAGHAAAEALGDAAAFQRTDVTDADQVQALIDFTVERFGGLHVMSNNAGVASSMTRFLHDDLSDFTRVVDINLLGVLLGTQRAARHMKANGGGTIINTSSTAGIDAGAGLITYRATKAAVIHATRSMALELAQYQIRVNCLVPGQIRTAMTTYDMDRVRHLTQPLPARAGPRTLPMPRCSSQVTTQRTSPESCCRSTEEPRPGLRHHNSRSCWQTRHPKRAEANSSQAGDNSSSSRSSPRRKKVGRYSYRRESREPCAASEIAIREVRSRNRLIVTRPSARARWAPAQ